jgi:hypothetical protein
VFDRAQILDRLKSWGRGKVVLMMLAALWATVKFVYLPLACSRAAAAVAQSYGVDLEVRDWSASVFDLATTAEKVVVRVAGPFEEDELLSADAVRVDLSLWRGLRGDGWVKEILLDDATLHVERLVSGRWNWESVGALGELRQREGLREPLHGGPRYAGGSGGPGERGVDLGADTALRVGSLRIAKMGVEWVEHLPGQSGSGLIHSQQASLFVDDVEGLVDQLEVPASPLAEPTRFTVEARIGDGRLSVDGHASFFAAVEAGRGPGVIQAMDGPRWSPSLEATIYLDNVGAGAFNRLLPLAAISPVAGSMDGEIRLAAYESTFECVADLVLTGVAYAANPDWSAAASRRQQIDDGLRGFTASGPVEASCSGDFENPEFRPLQAMHTAVTLTALEEAPPQVLTAAAEAQPGLTSALVDAGLDVAGGHLARHVGADAAADVTEAAKQERKGLFGKIKGLFKKKDSGG